MTTSPSSTAGPEAARDQLPGRPAATPLPGRDRWQRLLAAIRAAHTSSVPF